MPIYDEYEDDCLDVIPKEPTLKPRSDSEENQVVTRSQKAEIREDSECAEGDSLPLCYFSFELIRQ